MRQSTNFADVEKAQALRKRAFRCDDRDALDGCCKHILIEDIRNAQVVCCFRMLLLRGTEISQSYSAQFYDLSALAGIEAPMVEIGRFCTDPDFGSDPDILRLAWAAMTQFVDAQSIEMMFGCSSFSGTNAELYLNSFAVLKERFQAPVTLAPRRKAPEVHCFVPCSLDKAERVTAMRSLPALLRTYLSMGGWVSDHAVIDLQMNTMHVFTGVEINAIPAARKRLLRAVAG